MDLHSGRFGRTVIVEHINVYSSTHIVESEVFRNQSKNSRPLLAYFSLRAVNQKAKKNEENEENEKYQSLVWILVYVT